jgi:hypothetical protein
LKRVVTSLLVLAAASFAACGDDNDEPAAESETELSALAPEPTGSLEDAVAELNQAIADGDCEALVATTFSVMRPNAQGDGPAEPGDPVQPQECAKESPAVPLLADIKGTTFEESEEYGPAAISQGSTDSPVGGYDMWAVVWLVDRDGEWRQTSFYPTDPQFEEDLPEEADPVGVTEEMVAAVQEEDCSQADQFFGEQTRFGATPEEGCEAILGGSIFAPAVQAAEDVTVEEIGASRDYAIVGIDTGETYFAAQLATPPIKPNQPPQAELQVADVLPLGEFEIVEQEEKG